MSDSILEKVLSSKEDQEKQDFNAIEVVNQLLRSLSSKESDVVRRRFGLMKNGKETLETIGSYYNVTRERIRQIENQSITKIKGSPVFHDVMSPVEHLISTMIDHHGGVMTQEMLFENILGVQATDSENQRSVLFILSQLLKDKVEMIPKEKKYRPSWKLKLTSMDFIDGAIEALYSVIEKAKKPQTFVEVYANFKETDFFQQNNQKLTEEAVISYLAISSKIGRNPFDEYGKSSWGLIQPRRMNDRVFLVLQKEKEPMHFEDIAKRITKIFKKKAYPPTVHNELILNQEYILVGRGIYALREWGFKEGVVADVIIDVLTNSSGPLERSEIVKRVLEQRIVKKNTIHLALTEKSQFEKTPDGKYMLKKGEKENIERE